MSNTAVEKLEEPTEIKYSTLLKSNSLSGLSEEEFSAFNKVTPLAYFFINYHRLKQAFVEKIFGSKKIVKVNVIIQNFDNTDSERNSHFHSLSYNNRIYKLFHDTKIELPLDLILNHYFMYYIKSVQYVSSSPDKESFDNTLAGHLLNQRNCIADYVFEFESKAFEKAKIIPAPTLEERLNPKYINALQSIALKLYKEQFGFDIEEEENNIVSPRAVRIRPEIDLSNYS